MHADEVIGEGRVGDDVLDGRHVAADTALHRVDWTDRASRGWNEARADAASSRRSEAISVPNPGWNGTTGTGPRSVGSMSRHPDAGYGRLAQSSESLLSVKQRLQVSVVLWKRAEVGSSRETSWLDGV